MNKNRYNHLNTALKEKFGERTLKICVDGGFSCPNRDGVCGKGGCIFCGSMGAGENIKNRLMENLASIKNQVHGFLNSYKGERANKFIVYFQSFSNTYDAVDKLRVRYNTALECSDKIVGLQVATRPDCINEEVVELLASYKNKYYVCVELGLQSSSDEIGDNINRCYTTKDFVDAVELLHRYKIDVVVHVMVGLPGERVEDISNTIKLINECACEGIKIHSTYVTSDSKLFEMYNQDKYVPITQEYYIDIVARVISNLNNNIIIHRINADPPKKSFVAPEWVGRKKIVINNINRKLAELDVFQGDKKLDFTL